MKKKKILKKILIGFFLFSLTACNSKTESNPKQAENSEESAINTEISSEFLEEDEVALYKNNDCNPIVRDENGEWFYGGDPTVLVDNDTVYLYTGHDMSSDNEVQKAIYNIPEWVCYSTKDLMNWNYEGIIMKASTEEIPWASDSNSAWASQVAKHYDPEAQKDQYYLYYCTWDKTSSGKMSIGVAISDSPTGPFKDKGTPLVKGTITEPQTSNWNDIDPTIWIETDENNEEHRYLAWGNSRFYLCELNEDMISVKDLNEDGEITYGYSKDSADILASGDGLSSFTEAPWIYRRQTETGDYYGPYYLFYANGWRERMAYATAENLLENKWTFGKVLMPPTATSNTNHMAVFDFKGKTYFVYHNGSLPGGNGYRRCACITELHFKEDGSIEEIPETAAGLSDMISTIYTVSNEQLFHMPFLNSNNDSSYPYSDIEIGINKSETKEDGQWIITDGKADRSKAAYISIQSENKPGLYITANSDNTVTLSQDTDASETMAKQQTFRTIKGLNDSDGISFESISQPKKYLTLVNDNLCLTDGTDKAAATFYVKNK